MLLLAALLWLCPGAAVLAGEALAQVSSGTRAVVPLDEADTPFDVSATPLDHMDFLLLTQSGYRIEDSRIYSSSSTEPVGRVDLSYILENLRSRRRLKALLELEMIFNRNFNRELPSNEREAVRRIAREHWALFPRSTREQMKPYFYLHELEQMSGEMSIGPAAQAAVPSAVAAQPTAVSTVSAPSISPFAAMAPLLPLGVAQQAKSAPAEPTPVPAQPAAVLPTPAPGVIEPAAVPPAPVPSPVQPAAAPPASIPAPAIAPTSVPVEPAPAPVQPAAVLPDPVPAPVQPAAAPAAPAPAFAAAPQFTYREPVSFSSEAFLAYIETAPYGRDVKPLLQLLAAYGRDPERRIALGLVQGLMPHIVLDSIQAGASARGVRAPAPGKLEIALNDGPVLLRRRKLFSTRTILLPDSPQFYRERGLAQRTQAAFVRENASESEADEDEGRTRIYRDGSRRLRLSQEQLAGELLAALLDADALLRGWKPDLHARLRSETARFRFYRALAKETEKEPALDRNLSAAYREWLERPEDFIDFMFQTWGLAQNKAREIALLESAGVLSAPEAEKARKSIPKNAPEGAGVTEIQVESPQVRQAWLEIDRLAREER
ncbi:MAG: hypothetical protein HY922_16115 [Elusimicrobia bacterium]|nr:hypothetical protein [Elusimicrobiota bacterium]